jgi:hypothetical protein
MSFVPFITVKQSALTPSYVDIVDASSGSDVLIVGRRVTIQDSLGNYLVPKGTNTNYVLWPLANADINLNILTEDKCVDILVEWLNVSNVAIYSYENTYPLAEFNKQFFVQLVADQGLTPGIYQDSNYSGNIAVFWSNIVAGINAVTDGSNIAAGQACFNRATAMRLQQNIYF